MKDIEDMDDIFEALAGDDSVSDIFEEEIALERIRNSPLHKRLEKMNEIRSS